LRNLRSRPLNEKILSLDGHPLPFRELEKLIGVLVRHRASGSASSLGAHPPIHTGPVRARYGRNRVNPSAQTAIRAGEPQDDAVGRVKILAIRHGAIIAIKATVCQGGVGNCKQPVAFFLRRFYCGRSRNRYSSRSLKATGDAEGEQHIKAVPGLAATGPPQAWEIRQGARWRAWRIGECCVASTRRKAAVSALGAAEDRGIHRGGSTGRRFWAHANSP
jgi:hypothetical protein